MHKCPSCENMTSYQGLNGLCIFCEKKLSQEEQEKNKKYDIIREPYKP